jgi:hypothetical protein
MVWLGVATPLVWLGLAALLEAWVGLWNCILGIFLKVGCSETLSMVGRVSIGWLGGG